MHRLGQVSLLTHAAQQRSNAAYLCATEVVFNEDHDAIDAALERKGEVGDVNTSDTHALSFSE
jgi:hypothetical protein